MPGPDYAEEYYRKYQEAYGAEQEQEEDEYNMEDYFSESDDGGAEVPETVPPL